jgi:alcohol dehydrogenase class IV
VADNQRRYAIESEIFDWVHVEPTDDSMNKATEYAGAQGPWDGCVAIGGGSAIDAAKAINLLASHPGGLMGYINKPICNAKVPPGQLKPLVAVPTTAGTGSESTAMCVLDILSMKVMTGISHWRLRPTLAVIDPLTRHGHGLGHGHARGHRHVHGAAKGSAAETGAEAIRPPPGAPNSVLRVPPGGHGIACTSPGNASGNNNSELF